MGSIKKLGLVVLLGILLAGTGLAQEATAQVPLALWRDTAFPDGLDIGYTMGISWGDYDADGYIDLYANFSGSLWRNVNGTSWQFARNLTLDLLPPAERRYGASFGDYDRDGLLDIVTSPRSPAWGDDRLHLLRNLGGGPNFEDVAGDPSILDVQPFGNAETVCWADVDGDRRLDLFVPEYPGSLGPGNFFFRNIGPVETGGPVGLQEMTALAGLDNTPGHDRPEGVQFADYDGDGDPDLFSNGTLYQNISSRGVPQFRPLAQNASGISLGSIEEGAMFFDYDMDADQDLIVVYTTEGVKIWENRGDGTVVEAEAGVVDSPLTGLNLGMSAEDWDNDGDVDFTTRQVFRQNMLIEEGARHFTVEPNNLPPADLVSATPAWGDWDRDGDLDCALGNYGTSGRLYENTLYTADTSAAAKRHVRVRAVGNLASAPRGLETEYGATVEVRTLNVSDGLRRKKLVASSHGWNNQNEYTLHFALPADPLPGVPGEDVHFDVSVDFPGLAGRGLRRIDPHVNPALGDLNLAALAEREITVYRCGQVVLDGVTYDPVPFPSPVLSTTTNGLMLPGVVDPLPDPPPVPQTSWYTGLAFDTLGATGSVRLEEILLDGQLDNVMPGCGQANLALWDVTTPGSPFLVSGSFVRKSTSARNRRSVLPVDLVLAANRSYRVVARVTDFRSTAITAPAGQAPLTVLGGLSFRDTSPCDGDGPAQATVDVTKTSIALRFRSVIAPSDPVGSTLKLGRGFRGAPVLKWQEVSADSYQILRCNAASAPCTPTLIGEQTETAYVDLSATGPPREHYWYLVKAVDECAPGF